jgi:hypothetical protein
VISPTELAEAFRARARELAGGVEMTVQQRNHLEIQIQAGARHIGAVAAAIEQAWQPVAVAMVEAVVDLGRQLAPPPAGTKPAPNDREWLALEGERPRPSGAGPAQPPAGAGAYKRGGRR